MERRSDLAKWQEEVNEKHPKKGNVRVDLPSRHLLGCVQAIEVIQAAVFGVWSASAKDWS